MALALRILIIEFRKVYSLNFGLEAADAGRFVAGV